jgi:hypothetical protein
VDRSYFVGPIHERPGSCDHRPRRCLLKGCERRFWPKRPQARYCSDVCQQAARRWRRWQSSQRYRTTEQGQEQRRQQSRRYRERLRQREAASAVEDQSREGQRPASSCADFATRPCARPGCYEVFPVAAEASHRRFCSVACRLALRRVLDREARYRARRRRQRRARMTSRRQRRDTS